MDFGLLVWLVHLPGYRVSLHLFHTQLLCCSLFQFLLFLVAACILILPWWMLILYYQFCIFSRSSPFFSWTACTPSPHLWTMVLICKQPVALSELELLHPGPWIMPDHAVPLNHLDHHHSPKLMEFTMSWMLMSLSLQYDRTFLVTSGLLIETLNFTNTVIWEKSSEYIAVFLDH